LPLAAGAAAIAILVTYGQSYPIREWLMLRVLGYWALSLYWGLGCLSAGLAIVHTVAPRQYRPTEVAFVGFALGVLAFGILVFGVGLLHGLGRAFFVLSPLACLLAGLPSLRRWFVACAWGRRIRGFRASPLAVLALAFGASCLVAVYVPILSPHNMEHDARWYHLPIAQQYASAGAITPFREGWFLGAYPHLSSLLYTWAFLLPAGIVHRISLAAHMELVVFLVTLSSVPALVRRLVPGRRAPVTWTAFFLFPALFVYDSNLSTGADHVAALFAPAGLLVLLPAVRSLSARHAALLGAVAAGAALTKYSAISLALPLTFALALRAALAPEHHRKRAFIAVGVAAGTFAVCWAPHWAKNLAWYGSPVYPMLSNYFPAHPWNASAQTYLDVFIKWALVRPTRDASGVLETVWAAATLGFRAFDRFHGDVPVIGFLFAATAYCLPLIRPRGRLLGAYALGFSAALVWYWTNHRDRYVQAFMPWLVAATAASLVLMWRERGPSGRVAAGLLVGTQLVAGAGLTLHPSYFMVPQGHPIGDVMRIVKAGYDKNYGDRFRPFEEWNFAAWTAVGRMLPRGARVLVHEDRLWLGIDAPVVVDEAQWQAGIRYSDLATPGDVYDLLRGYGVTHIVTGKNHGDGGDQGVKGNLLFWDFVTTYAPNVGRSGGLSLWAMPAVRPVSPPPGAALVVTCNLSVQGGLYDWATLSIAGPALEVPPQSPAALHEALGRATYLVIEDECGYTLDPDDDDAFPVMGARGKVTFRKREAKPVSAGP
jgi:hypothetical protein